MATNILSERYGLVPMSLEEEISISDTVRQKRNAKITIVDDVASIRMMLESIEDRAKGIPEIESMEHLGYVKEFQRKVRELYLMASAVSENGIS